MSDNYNNGNRRGPDEPDFPEILPGPPDPQDMLRIVAIAAAILVAVGFIVAFFVFR